MAAPSATTIDSGETFRLRNDHPSEDLVLKHEKRTFRVSPGKSALVPFEVIRVWWGDPRCRPGQYIKFSDSREKGWVNKREDEIKRLGVLYGSYASDVGSLNDPNWPPQDKRYGVVPKRTPWPITVMTEAGQEVTPCGLDLTGEAVYATIRDDSEDLNDQVVYREHLERQLDEIKEQLRAMQGGPAIDDTEVDEPGR